MIGQIQPKKSTTGMNNMDSRTLKAVDICRIIKECRNSGVSELKFGELHLKFSSTEEMPTQSQGWAGLTQQPLPRQVDEATTTAEKMGVNEDIAEDALYAQVMIDDPAAFEKLQHLEMLESKRVEHESTKA